MSKSTVSSVISQAPFNVDGTDYRINVVKTMTCMAGTAYWTLQLCRAGFPGAIYTHGTGAIYGEPDLTRFRRRAIAHLRAEAVPASGIPWENGYGLIAYGETLEDAINWMAKAMGASHVEVKTGVSQSRPDGQSGVPVELYYADGTSESIGVFRPTRGVPVK